MYLKLYSSQAYVLCQFLLSYKNHNLKKYTKYSRNICKCCNQIYGKIARETYLNVTKISNDKDKKYTSFH